MIGLFVPTLLDFAAAFFSYTTRYALYIDKSLAKEIGLEADPDLPMKKDMVAVGLDIEHTRDIKNKVIYSEDATREILKKHIVDQSIYQNHQNAEIKIYEIKDHMGNLHKESIAEYKFSDFCFARDYDVFYQYDWQKEEEQKAIIVDKSCGEYPALSVTQFFIQAKELSPGKEFISVLRGNFSGAISSAYSLVRALESQIKVEDARPIIPFKKIDKTEEQYLSALLDLGQSTFPKILRPDLRIEGGVITFTEEDNLTICQTAVEAKCYDCEKESLGFLAQLEDVQMIFEKASDEQTAIHESAVLDQRTEDNFETLTNLPSDTTISPPHSAEESQTHSFIGELVSWLYK